MFILRITNHRLIWRPIPFVYHEHVIIIMGSPHRLVMRYLALDTKRRTTKFGHNNNVYFKYTPSFSVYCNSLWVNWSTFRDRCMEFVIVWLSPNGGIPDNIIDIFDFTYYIFACVWESVLHTILIQISKNHMEIYAYLILFVKFFSISYFNRYLRI